MVKTTILKFFFFTYFEDFYEIKPMLIFFFFQKLFKASLKPYPESTKTPRNTNFDNLNSNYIGLHPFFLQHILFLCRTLGFLQEIELECEKT